MPDPMLPGLGPPCCRDPIQQTGQTGQSVGSGVEGASSGPADHSLLPPEGAQCDTLLDAEFLPVLLQEKVKHIFSLLFALL